MTAPLDLDAIRISNNDHTLRCRTNVRHVSIKLQIEAPGTVTVGEIAMLETAASQLQLLYSDIDALLAEVVALREDNQHYADFIAFIPTGTFTIERLPSGMFVFTPSDLTAELAACRAKNKELHRRAQKAESAVLKAQPKPVDTWKSRERQQEADARDRMMAAVGRERDREEKVDE